MKAFPMMIPAGSFVRRACFVSVAVCFGTAAFAGEITGLPNFHKVNDAVYRGGQPASDGFRYLASLGVKTIIDLREPGEHSQAQEKAWVASDGMRYISIPLHGMAAPSDADVKKILAILNDPAAGPVFIHCRRGADRTGTIIACYRITHDHWENRAALHEARAMGMSFLERAMQGYVGRYNGSGLPTEATATVASQQQ